MICQKTYTQLNLGDSAAESVANPAVQPKSQPVVETSNLLESEKQRQRREYIKQWYEKNPEKKQVYYRSYMERHGKELMEKRRTPEGKAKIAESNKKQRLKNIDEKREYMKKWYQLHKHDPHRLEKQRINSKAYYERHREQERERGRLYSKNNPEKIRERFRRLRRTDLNFAMKDRLRATMNRGLRRQWARKSRRTMELVGCSVEELKAHIEKQFKDGMCWENRRQWHVDHIRPLSSFDLTDPEQQKIAFNYMNLQPLWAHENHAKSDKFETAKNPAAVSSLPGRGVGSGYLAALRS